MECNKSASVLSLSGIDQFLSAINIGPTLPASNRTYTYPNFQQLPGDWTTSKVHSAFLPYLDCVRTVCTWYVSGLFCRKGSVC